MKITILSARLILFLWAGFWILFVLGSVIGGGGKTDVPPGESLKGILMVVGTVIVCLAAVYFAWRPPRVAGIASIVVGILVTAAFLSISGPIGVLLIIALPPFLSGTLFLVYANRLRCV